MNRNRFRKKTVSNLGLSSRSINTTNGDDEDGPTTPTTPRHQDRPATSMQTSPFIVPEPSPKRPSAKKRLSVSPVKLFNTERDNARSKRRKCLVNDMDLPLFERALSRCGLTFVPNGDAPHTLDQESIYFVRGMQKELGEKLKLVCDKLEDFMQRFISLHVDDKRLLKKSLLPIKRAEGNDGFMHSEDSLIHLLLQVEPIQGQMLEFLFEKLSVHVIEPGELEEGLNDLAWSKLMLSQLRGINYLVDSKSFTLQLLDLLQLTSSKEILIMFLLLLPEYTFSEHEPEVAKALCKMLTSSHEFVESTSEILDALGNLTSSREVREEIMDAATEMLQYQRKFMPQVVKFMLTEAHLADELSEVIQMLRKHVNLVNNLPDVEKQEHETMSKVIKTLRASLCSIRDAPQVWLTIVTADKTVTTLDLAVLMEVFELGDKKNCKLVLSLIKSKCVSGAIEESTLEKIFKYHGNTLAEDIRNLESLLRIPNHLMESPDKNVLHHAALWYKFMFLYIDDTLKRRVILRNIVMQIYADSRGNQSALWVLSQLVEQNMGLMLTFASQLMLPEGMLPRVKNVCAEHARQIMDIMCRLAYSGDSNIDTLQGDISMIINKQLAWHTPSIKRKGIVGAVMAIKHLAHDTDEASSASKSIVSEDSHTSLPISHKVTEAQDLVGFVRSCVKMYPDALGFFMDELATMVHDDYSLNRTFMLWLTEEMVNEFTDDFTIEVDAEQDDNQLMKQENYFLLDENNPIIMGLGSHVAQQQLINHGMSSNTSAKTVFPNTVCSFFRLVRMLKYSIEQGNLEDIDALLGCAIQLPKNLPTLTRGTLVSISDPLKQQCMLDSLFLAINWLREVINAFIFVQQPEVQDKVLQRIRHIVMLEKKVMELIPAFPPGYAPPLCQFYATVKPQTKRGAKGKNGKNGRKKRRKQGIESSIHPALDGVNPNLDSSEEEDISEDDIDEKEGEASLTSLRGYLRELDMPIFLMFSRPFTINPDPPQVEKVSVELGPAELVFLLEDFSAKLEHHLMARAVNSSKRGRGFPRAAQKLGEDMSASEALYFHLDRIDVEKVAVNAVRIVTKLCGHLEQVIAFFQELEEKNDGVRDGPGSDSELARDLSHCFLLILKSMRATFAWDRFYTAKRALLLDTLREIAKRIDQSKDLNNPQVVSTVCRYLKGFGHFITQLPTAVALVSLMQIVATHDADDNSKETPKNHDAIRELCETFLKREWPPLRDPSPTLGALVSQMVQIYIDCNEIKLASTLELLKMIKDGGDNLKGKGSGFIEDMPAISKATLANVFEVLAAGVASGSHEACADPEHLTQSQAAPKVEAEMTAWNLVIEALRVMVDIAKQHDQSQILKSLFKHSQATLQLFMDYGMKVMDKALRRHPAQVQALLKRLQTVTRFLQQVCCHSKMKGALGIVQTVPNMRYLLEKLVQRVKGMLVGNRCTEAFWIGNLKNRDLKGQEIQTQAESEEGSESEESEEEVRRSKLRKTSSTSQAGPSHTQSSRAGPSQSKNTQHKTQKSQKKTQKETQKTQKETQKSQKTQKKTQITQKKTQKSQITKKARNERPESPSF